MILQNHMPAAKSCDILSTNGGVFMEFKERSDKKILDDIKSAGQTFLGLRMEDLLLRINELDDTDSKKQLIQGYYEHQIGTHDDKFDGTRTRVNSAIRIIAANKVLFALNIITNSNFRVPPDAVLKASETIAKIERGEIKLPILS